MMLDVIFFMIRGRRCALPVSSVREVLAYPNLTPVPSAPYGIRGVAPVHGQALPLVDLGVWMSGTGEPRTESDASLLRSAADQVLIIETAATPESTPLRAALAVDKVLRLGSIDEEHARPAPLGPTFVSATLMDADGPTLLLDTATALEHVRQTIASAVRS